MTYEPGTADTFTTCDPPLSPEEESAVLRAVFQRAASDRCVVAKHDRGKWYMQIDGWVPITDTEREILTRIAVEAG